MLFWLDKITLDKDINVNEWSSILWRFSFTFCAYKWWEWVKLNSHSCNSCIEMNSNLCIQYIEMHSINACLQFRHRIFFIVVVCSLIKWAMKLFCIFPWKTRNRNTSNLTNENVCVFLCRCAIKFLGIICLHIKFFSLCKWIPERSCLCLRYIYVWCIFMYSSNDGVVIVTITNKW